jgi:hypothetical protein
LNGQLSTIYMEIDEIPAGKKGETGFRPVSLRDFE